MMITFFSYSIVFLSCNVISTLLLMFFELFSFFVYLTLSPSSKKTVTTDSICSSILLTIYFPFFLIIELTSKLYNPLSFTYNSFTISLRQGCKIHLKYYTYCLKVHEVQYFLTQALFFSLKSSYQTSPLLILPHLSLSF